MIVLALTAVPCCALEDSQSHVHERSENKKADKSTDKEDGCCKECSPFYVCGTCTGFTISKYSPLTFAIYLNPIQHSTAYPPVALPVIPVTIWQPPKIS